MNSRCFIFNIIGLISVTIMEGVYSMEMRDPVQVCSPLKKQRLYEPVPLMLPMSLAGSPVAPHRTALRKPLSGISPQKVQMPADNVARKIYNILKEESESSPQKAVSAILNWQQKFPAIFGKIKWFTREDQRDDIQADFKFKLAGALHHIVLTCLAKSSYTDLVTQSKEINEHGGVDTYVSTLRLGGFLCGSKISRIELRPSYSFQKVSGDCVPVYNQENKIKESLKNCLFTVQDTVEFQQLLQDLLSSIPKYMRINKEQFYHALVYGIISFMGSSFSIIEAYSGEGRADMLLVSDMGGGDSRNCIIEFKFNRSAEEALRQIETMQYCKYFDPGCVIAVGINIKENPLQVTCVKRIICCPVPVVSQVDGVASGSITWC